MLRYELDKLGWYDFEGLVQALLKANLGLGVEAWGGIQDWGRDAYFEGELAYPTNSKVSSAFLFQCKFVDGANAAGAQPESSILNAVAKECRAIKDRLQLGRWPLPPSYYVLFTNARMTAKNRESVNATLHGILPKANLFIHDGNDICAWLDNSPQIVKAFPQLLGLRNLDELLRSWVNADILSRSETALEEG